MRPTPTMMTPDDSTTEETWICSLSLDCAVDLRIPKSECRGMTVAQLKAWVWERYQDKIFNAIQLKMSESNSGVSRSCAEGETKDMLTIAPNNNKKNNLSPRSERETNSRETLLDTIAYVQRQFFQSASPKVVFGCLLEGLLDMMSSEYGFIGEIKNEPDGTMYLQTHAITNIAWNQATMQFYKDNINNGLKFYNLNTLFGKVMTTQEPVIANDPKSDPRAAGLPDGHPPLNHFLGLPFFYKEKMTGMVGISNKPGGYSEADIEFLEPLTITCSNLIQAYQQVKENEYLINTLEESVKARTRELVQVNQNLEKANQQVRQNAALQLSSFAAMSHEIRTPLNCILGMSSLLQGTMMTPTQAESIKMIVTSGELLMAIVNDVLDYSKLETDHVKVHVQRSNLQDMLHSIMYSIEMKAKDQGQVIKAIYDPDLPMFVETDIRKIQQILFNLLGNAVKFNRANCVVELSVAYEKVSDEVHSEIQRAALPENVAQPVSISTSQQHHESKLEDDVPPSRCPFDGETAHKTIINPAIVAETPTHQDGASKHWPQTLQNRSRCKLVFTVKDYGRGIDRSEFDAIFRPFQQAWGVESNSVYGGTGLGLAITKKLVSAMGGTISVDSEVGSWSKFTVKLPCTDGPAPVDELTKAMSDATILVVGMPPEQEENMMRIFQAFRLDVRLLDNLEEAAPMVSSSSECHRSSSKSISQGRRIICLVNGEKYTPHGSFLISDWRTKFNSQLTVLTFGPHVAINTATSMDASSVDNISLNHIRSLEQMIPQALIELLHKSSYLPTASACSKHADWHSSRKERVPGQEQEISYHHLRVLIAEDNKINQKVLRGMLSRLSIDSVDVVDNGQDAVDREASTPYDVILMDQQMPIMGGVEACRMIVNRQKSSTSPHPVPFVIFVSAHVSVDFEMECRAAGSSGFLAKPFKVDDIERCFRDLSGQMAMRKRAKSNVDW